MATARVCRWCTLLWLVSLCSHASWIEAGTSKWESCKSGPFAVENAVMTPDPPVRNQALNITLYVNNQGSEVPGGVVKVSAYWYGIWMPVEQPVLKLCSGTVCPVPHGNVVLSSGQTFPGDAPSGSYVLEFNGFSDRKAKIMCVRFKFQLGSGSKKHS